MNAENLKTIATEIETALCEVTKKLVSREGDAKVRPREGVDNACWTKAIKTRLCKLGACKKYYICALGVEWVCDGKPDDDHGCAVEHEKKCKPNHGEWLYDVCWLDWKKKDPPRLKQVVLAAECEWGNDGDIYDDFEKLVQSRAGLRVMIFTKKNQEAVNGMIDDLKACASGFEQMQPDDKYLFCGYDEAESKFISRRWQVSCG